MATLTVDGSDEILLRCPTHGEVWGFTQDTDEVLCCRPCNSPIEATIRPEALRRVRAELLAWLVGQQGTNAGTADALLAAYEADAGVAR